MCNEMLRILATFCIILSVSQTAAFQSFSVRAPHSPSASREIRTSLQMGLTFKDLRSLSVKEALNAICGPCHDLDEKYKFPNTDIAKKAPTVCTYVIANPKAFFEKPRIAKAYGVDMESISPNTPLEELAKLLPVVYIADVHTEYGTLGYQLNKRSENTMNDIFPELRSFRQTPVFLGGQQNKGSSFTMVHSKVGFPDNRGWRGLPGNSEFRLFFSPNTAMANELCMTKDALPTDFKFFQWATVWLPNQLQIEYDQKLWLSVTAPVTAIFDDKNNDVFPLWGRLVASFPPDRLKGTKKITEIIENEETVNVSSASSSSIDNNRDIIVESDSN